MPSALYVADDIQTLHDGKLLLVGLFSDRVVIFQSAKDPNVPEAIPGVLQLCFMVTLTDVPTGSYAAHMKFVGPDGNEFASPLGPWQVKTEAGRSINLVAKISPFAAKSPGVYTISCELSDTLKFEEQFEVRFADAPPSVARND